LKRQTLQLQLLLRSDVFWLVNKTEVLPDDLAGNPSRRPGHFFCFAKRSNQEKATPDMSPFASLRVPTPPAPKSGSVGNSLRSDSRRFFIRFRHRRRGAINGDPRQKQRQIQKQRQQQQQQQQQQQLSLRGQQLKRHGMA
jgi:hypothetical protein